MPDTIETAPADLEGAVEEVRDEETVEAAPQEAESADHADMFDRSFREFFFRIRKIGDTRKVSEIEATFRGNKLAEDMVSGTNAKIIPPNLSRAIDAAEYRTRKLVHARCLPGEGQGFYLVRADEDRATEFIEEFNAALKVFNDAADAVSEKYDDIVKYNRDRWLPKMKDEADYQANIGRLLPPNKEALRGCYEVIYRMRNAGEGRAGAKYRDGAVRAWFEAAHESAVKHAHDVRRERLRLPLDGLRETLAGFKVTLNSGSKIVPKSFNRFEDALTLFRSCADIVAPELIGEVDALAKTMAEVKEAASGAKGAFSDTVLSHKVTLNELIDRMVGECKAATSEAAIADKMGRQSRGYRIGRASRD